MHWIVLNDGAAEHVTPDMIDAAEEAAVISNTLIPLTESEVGTPRGRQSTHTVVGEVSGKYALIRMLDEGVTVADVAVCLHSRAAPGLWRRMWPHGPDDTSMAAWHLNMPANAPWCVVRCHAPEAALPHWFDRWTQVVAIALMQREGW